jgi:hypothetical protein
LDTSVFAECENLEKVDLPSVTSFIGTDGSYNTSIFMYCTSLTAIILRSETKCSVAPNCAYFDSTPIINGTGYIYVPAALVSDYIADENWSYYGVQFRALEDYTVDGTITGELDENKV